MRAQSANPESHFLYIYVSTKHTRAKRASKMWAQSPREQSDQVACRASQKRQEGPSKASIYYWNRMVCLFVCLFVCLYLSSAYSFGPIGMKLGPWEWHGVCEVELCHSLFVLRAYQVKGLNLFYTSTNRGGFIFSLQFVCVSVCLSVCVSGYSCEQNSSRTDTLIWTRFSLNGCLHHWLGPYWNWWPWIKGQGHSGSKSIFPS